MTDLRIESLPFSVNGPGETGNVIPFQVVNVQNALNSRLDPDDEVYVGYGALESSFPYTSQSFYSRERQNTTLMGVVLENEYLKATVLPELGGRLWSLYDKSRNCDLLLSGNEITFANLALRDAWFCGGVEWNFGAVGHCVFTCSPLHTALLKTANGTPVLRLYEYERIRRCVYQVDIWLPEHSPRLFVGVRLYNPNQAVVPTYWWSNIAVPEYKKGRIIVPANEAYGKVNGTVYKRSDFIRGTQDITYPVQNPRAVDWFWRTKNAPCKFVCAVDDNGYGLCQASTSRQRGRKLFVWGQGKSAENWQNVLRVGAPTGRYIEVQAGLGQTQYECIPMPPGTVWEWVESYGAVDLGAAAHGDYEKAQQAADDFVATFDLETVLQNATHMSASADRVILRGSGFGALEALCREEDDYPLPAHLDFGTPGAEQQPWLSLLQNGTVGTHDPALPPISYMADEKFKRLLIKATENADRDNWYAHFMLGALCLAKKDHACAEEHLTRSLALAESPYVHYTASLLYTEKDDPEKAIAHAQSALSFNTTDRSLVRGALQILIHNHAAKQALSAIAALPETLQNDCRVLCYQASALLQNGDYAAANDLLARRTDDMVTNIREGEFSISQMWVEVQEHLPENQGKTKDELNAAVPTALEFRSAY